MPEKGREIIFPPFSCVECFQDENAPRCSAGVVAAYAADRATREQSESKARHGMSLVPQEQRAGKRAHSDNSLEQRNHFHGDLAQGIRKINLGS